MKGLQRVAGVVLLLVFAVGASAAPRAWLDRTRINEGDTVTLNIESESSDTPDFSVLESDFDIRGQSSQTQTTISNGSVSTRTLWAVALEPHRTGVLQIPAIAVGKESTLPLSLTVGAAAVGVQAQGQDVFLEVQIDTRNPYVGQAVIYTVRLNYAITLLDGDLDTPQVDGADLRRIGDDVSYQRVIAGRRYQTLERRFAMSPEHSGELTIGGPRFRGRTLAGLRDSMFGGARAISAVGESLTLTVRPQPAQAASPWLPATAVSLEMTAPASAAHVGEPVNLELHLHVEGAQAAQVPELALPEVPGLRVFPDVAKVDERVVDGVLQADVRRRFALVASHPGTLQIPAVQVPWWNVASDQGELAKASAVALVVSPAPATDAGPTAVTIPDAPAAAPITPAPPQPASLRGWQLLSATLLLLWLGTALLAWQRGALRLPPRKTVAATRPRDEDGERALRRALANDDLSGIDAALRRIAAGQSLDALLDDPAQREAVALLHAALWGQGDRSVARAALRKAFAGGVKAKAKPAADETPEPLPPLYPR